MNNHTQTIQTTRTNYFDVGMITNYSLARENEPNFQSMTTYEQPTNTKGGDGKL